ncbi:MAG: FkbM family methyltransferase [Ignavibacteriales bacterium]|nr:FkbM family methyltransferase [Ignavibacteriales bacterium]
MMLWAAKLYSMIYRLVQDRLHFNIRGIGYIVSRIKKDTVLSVHKDKFYFNHTLSSCYLRMLSGDYNEPETHYFVNFLINRSKEKIIVLDVGANIGEMVIDFSGRDNVARVIAFEPNPECAATIEKSIALNGRNNVMLVRKAASDEIGTATFHLNPDAAVTSSLMNSHAGESLTVATTTVDHECSDIDSPSIMIIDVEGAELLVMKGARQFIRRNQPVIIFEHHDESKKHYSLEEVTRELGERYEIFRLRQDGFLDSNLERTWNCVAISKDSWAYSHSMTRKRYHARS